VQRADLHHDDRARRAGREMGAALGAELTRDRSRQILARELPRRALGVAKGVRGHDHEEGGPGAPAGLAFTAVTLRLHHWFAVDEVAHGAAVASAFGFH